ncbi:unnamed protein product [Rangifer tarandus platyrhynchus]|uniref:Uncharacterized protein n=2 Tax=Rangifer tarandus platyrhynchus TaxID=3082113 RepID=A0ACB0F707_RANTA|nr:unnamed protein product [Rangifer tarandus platyrhynchus]CAI9708044.1 unnamed protein product [Rangifer tarandus platyrhynchus]
MQGLGPPAPAPSPFPTSPSPTSPRARSTSRGTEQPGGRSPGATKQEHRTRSTEGPCASPRGWPQRGPGGASTRPTLSLQHAGLLAAWDPTSWWKSMSAPAASRATSQKRRGGQHRVFVGKAPRARLPLHRRPEVRTCGRAARACLIRGDPAGRQLPQASPGRNAQAPRPGGRRPSLRHLPNWV